MKTEFWYTLARMRGQIIGWSLAVFLLGLLLVPFYDTVVENQAQFAELLEAYPPELLAFFGDITSIVTPEGYLSLEYFSFMPLVLGIYAVLAGSGLIASDEEGGTLDLVMAYPISRSALFWGRVLAFIASTLIILAIGWLGIYLPSLRTELDLSPVELARPFVALFSIIVLFGGLALLFSMMLPARRVAAMTAGLLLVISFFLEGLSELTDKLDQAVKISPLHYYQSGEAINGLNWDWMAGLGVAALIFALGAWQLFERRDIRISGEGSSVFAGLLQRRRAGA